MCVLELLMLKRDILYVPSSEFSARNIYVTIRNMGSYYTILQDYTFSKLFNVYFGHHETVFKVDSSGSER